MGLPLAKLWVEVGANTKPAEKALGAFSSQLSGIGRGMMTTGAVMTAGITAPLVMGFKGAVSAAVEYEGAMNMVRAVTGANGAEFAALAEQARALGADEKIAGTSAMDAATAQLELAKAGLSIKDVLGATTGVVQMAAAGNLDNASAAMIAANALNAWKMQGTEAIKVADLLAAAANASSAEVVDMADSLQMSSAVLASAGIPIDATIAMLAELANKGIMGSDAGTSLKQMFLSLQAPSEKAKDLMKQYGISVYDANGNMMAARDIIAQFQEGLSGLTQQQRDLALATIFGSDAVRSANIVLMGGIEAYDKSYAAVTKQGAAAELAAARMEGLPGEIEQMNSSLQDMAVALGEAMSGPVSDAAEWVTGLAKSFNSLDPDAQKQWAGVALAVAAIGPALTGLGGASMGVSAIANLLGKLPGLLTFMGEIGAGLSLLNGGAGTLEVMGLGGGAAAAGILSVLAPIAALVGTTAILNEVGEKQAETFQKQQEQVKANSTSYAQYSREMMNLARNTHRANEVSIDSHGNLIETVESYGYTYQRVLQENYLIGRETFEAMQEQVTETGRYFDYYNSSMSMDGVASEFDQVAAAGEGAAEAAAGVAEQIGILSSVDTSFGSKIADALNSINFRQAGGMDYQGLSEEILTAVDQGKITEEQGKELLSGLFAASEALKVEMGEITAYEAAANIRDQLGGSLSEASLLLDGILQKMDSFPEEIKVKFAFMVTGTGKVSAKTTGKNTPEEGMATGGPVWAGRSYYVGERGAEVFEPETNGRIIPNGRGGGVTLVNYGRVKIDSGSAFGRSLLEGLG